MGFFSLRQWLQRQPRAARRASASRSRFRKVELELLETRLAPATAIWTGGAGAGNRNWTTAANWNGSIAPSPGDDLVFPTGVPAASLNTINNYAVGTAFNSISISA